MLPRDQDLRPRQPDPEDPPEQPREPRPRVPMDDPPPPQLGDSETGTVEQPLGDQVPEGEFTEDEIVVVGVPQTSVVVPIGHTGYEPGLDGLVGDAKAAELRRMRADRDDADEAWATRKNLALHQKVPNKKQGEVVGVATTKIVRDTPEYKALVKNTNPDIVFKDEEGTGADQMVTPKLNEKLDALAAKVKAEWPDVKLRVTETWDENDEHSTNSVHYEARAADLTTSDQDNAKLGRLGRLAVDAGFEWVFYEDTLHIHASVSK